MPPAFEAGSPLVATLRERRRPLALSAAGRTPDAAELGPFDRAALEALEAEVVVPVRRDETLLAFLCLGPKRSGDVYTSTDLSLLAAVAEAVSSQLRRFDQEEVIREARAMQESLRRYVPGAVAEQLASGAELGARRARGVGAVRGPARLHELRRGAARRGDLLHREPLHRGGLGDRARARRRGGRVQRRRHDGGLRRAAGAARQGARGGGGGPRDRRRPSRRCRVEGAAARGRELSVGVGIATGAAFVGSIRAADRMIWTAIGNTTNLAARLQGLSRELDAALVIDARTWEALGETRRDFARHSAIAIRGRGGARTSTASPRTVYVSPSIDSLPGLPADPVPMWPWAPAANWTFPGPPGPE